MRLKLLVAAGLALALAACQEESYRSTRHLTPIPPATVALMSKNGMQASDPILMRSFKKESEIEVWKRGADGQYALLKTYPMCRWSGQLGPKIKEGDRQAPEGFYNVTPAAMNPNSSLFLSFDLGYPNAFDQAHGRTGSHLMVHGSCSSRGCFAMTDEAVSEVYALARESFAAGQRSFQFQSYPFRMTPENLAKHRADQHIAFWTNLKEGYDQFEVTKQEPTWSVVAGRYAFKAEPSAAAAVAAKQARDDQEVAGLVANGTSAIRLVYNDGGGHQSFREVAMAASGASSFAALDDRTRRSLGDVSRPDALASGPQEIPIEVAAVQPSRLAKVATPPAARSELQVAAKQPAPASAGTRTAVADASAVEEPAAAPPASSPSFYERTVGGLLGR